MMRRAQSSKPPIGRLVDVSSSAAFNAFLKVFRTTYEMYSIDTVFDLTVVVQEIRRDLRIPSG